MILDPEAVENGRHVNPETVKRRQQTESRSVLVTKKACENLQTRELGRGILRIGCKIVFMMNGNVFLATVDRHIASTSSHAMSRVIILFRPKVW
jgi:hypothetical protein